MVSDAIDEVCRSFHITQDDVRLFVHDSAPYLTKGADHFQKKRGTHIVFTYVAGITCVLMFVVLFLMLAASLN